MPRLSATERVHPTPLTDPHAGQIRLDRVKTFWLLGHAALGVAGVLLFPRLDAFLVFLALTAITISAGHSVGMHRLLIHRSFEAPKPVEYALVWLGTLVGMAGPMGMIRAHDMRDWHQRQTTCPPHPAHAAPFFRDAYWQLCCTYALAHPPELRIEAEVAEDRVYRWMERLWMAQQIPLALLLFALGGWAFVLWGISLRIAVSLIGHWMVGHFAHKPRPLTAEDYVIAGLPVQGTNLPRLAHVTFGEAWHGNHHAFPHSARLGLGPHQPDPGYALIRGLARLGLARNIRLPTSEPLRAGLRRATAKTSPASAKTSQTVKCQTYSRRNLGRDSDGLAG